jgi:coenzyme F420-reducing hydrogenase beta subunit
MTKSELKEIIKSVVCEEFKGYTKDPETGKYITTKGGTSKEYSDILTRIAKGTDKLDEGEEKTYIVFYYTMDNRGNDLDWDETVQATSEKDAIAKVKAKGIRNARAFSAKLKK